VVEIENDQFLENNYKETEIAQNTNCQIIVCEKRKKNVREQPEMT